MKRILLTMLLLGAVTFSLAQQPLRVMVIFAHPDEGEIYAGGVTALYTQLGHEVKFMSLTNGDAGHFSMNPEDLAKRRYKEAMKAKEILGLSEYEILDYHDGVLKNEEEVREKVISSINALIILCSSKSPISLTYNYSINIPIIINIPKTFFNYSSTTRIDPIDPSNINQYTTTIHFKPHLTTPIHNTI